MVAADGDILSYERYLQCGTAPRCFEPREPGQGIAHTLGRVVPKVMLSTYMDREAVSPELMIRANEGLILGLG